MSAAVVDATAPAVQAGPGGGEILRTSGLRRAFGETVALADCSFDVRLGEIHALVGENGSGKSTLIKILSGILPPDGGTLAWDGAPARFGSPREAQHAGIATVFQETLVLDQLTVRDNVVLGLDPLVRRRISAAEERRLTRTALDRLGLDLDGETPLARLSLAERQSVTIARALLRPWRLLILDEATSALDIGARDRLFDALRRFAAEGRAVLLISHRMDEIETLADRATVLQSGRSVATLAAAESSTERLLALMSTREEAMAVEGDLKVEASRSLGPAVLTLTGVAVQPGAAPSDLAVRAGEIVGLAGLEGHGQVAFLECAVGLSRPAAGTVATADGPVASFAGAARQGVIYLPRDRKT
ncbi:MAG TPA: ATP-binding cassette domain-containing protein [Hyphomicrobiales bacterium]|nr:ATP-binding cassette domain-containing protein [Hyphomicrobiales bacterium]